MNLLGKHLHRRTFLKGVGATIALPSLDAMRPAGARAAALATEAPRRLGFVYVPNGVVMDSWTPAAVGTDFEYTPILKPLEKYRDKILIVSGTMAYNANALGDGGGDHARAGAAFLTGAHPKKTGGFDIELGTSADQVAAQAVGHQTRLPSLELSLDDNRTTGHCDSGYSCAYTNSISWRSPTTPNPPEANPRAVFERLFGDYDSKLDPETIARRQKYRRSILDSTLDEARRIAGDLGASDRNKVDEYLTSIREVEQRIAIADSQKIDIDLNMTRPAGIPAEFAEHAKLMFDLQALAFQADLTRIMSFMIGREGSVRTYPEIGVPDPHHPLSHHRNREDSLAKLVLINTYHMELFAHFINRLQSIPEGDGTLLDNCMMLYGCAISDSNRHTHEGLPALVVGSGGGSIQTGRHIQLEEDTPMTNLFLALVNRMGANAEAIGDSTGVAEI